ncbi:unnamed protein product [Ceutorhynchus assimilis]|uniref:Glutathione S-transferase n=1 Tax=Ceutorhynchus assimilis TaxID=467358 RepID=A0A9N9QJ82_9CUCU|nr:unnamed protein product [Ceutorhynchus assimilis]
MGKKLYIVWGSPPVNAVIMTAKALNVELELHEVDFANKEYLSHWYLKINPSHTVPALDDDGFILWDSHAILVYLAETYGKGSTLFSTEPKERYKILQMLNFDCGIVTKKMANCIWPLFYEDQTSIDPKQLEYLKDVHVVLERILKTTKYVAGERFTIADISIFSSLTIADMILPIQEDECPNLKKWFLDYKNSDLYKAGEKSIETTRLGLKFKLGNVIE